MKSFFAIALVSILSQGAMALDLDLNKFAGKLEENLLVQPSCDEDCSYSLKSIMNVGLVETARSKVGPITHMEFRSSTKTQWQAGATFLDVKNLILDMDLSALPADAYQGALVDGSMTIVQEDGNHMGSFSRTYKADCTYINTKLVTCISYVGESSEHSLRLKIQAAD